MVDFAGWEMPVQYSTIVEEHRAVRTAAGLFDIGHMGRLEFTGPDACRFLDHLLTNDVTKLAVGLIRYSLITNEDGGILDDVLVYRTENAYLLVVNASNRTKIVEWIDAHQESFDVTVNDRTVELFMLAIQGPQSVDILNPLVDADISLLGYYTGQETRVIDRRAYVSRTGYTGEDGFEVMLPAEAGPQLYDALMRAGEGFGILPTGLGCRDTLRLEAAMPLYGHELDESIDPFTAGISFGVKLGGGEFIGKQALVEAKARSDRPVRVGLELAGRRIAREGAELFHGDVNIGRITSGTFSPTLEKPIAMGYVDREHSSIGTDVEVDIRGKRMAASVVQLPFYTNSKKS